jgi:hypothetical protein
MNIFCIRCGEEISPLAKFCPFCGEEAPRSTLPADLNVPPLTKGYYCSVCRYLNLTDALFCEDCGHNLFVRDTTQRLFCPKCKVENPSSSHFCYKCQLNLDAWFEQKGTIADDVGYVGDFSLFETMNRINYHFYHQPVISIGRAKENSIPLSCQFVSAKHLEIDLEKGILCDLASSNGTFINYKPEKIQQPVPLTRLEEWNVAGVFTFGVLLGEGWMAFSIKEILNSDPCNACLVQSQCENWRQQFHIAITGDGEIYIRRFDGHLEIEPTPGHEYFSVNIEDGYFYLSDLTRKINHQLLLKRHNRLPMNWKLELMEEKMHKEI